MTLEPMGDQPEMRSGFALHPGRRWTVQWWSVIDYDQSGSTYVHMLGASAQASGVAMIKRHLPTVTSSNSIISQLLSVSSMTSSQVIKEQLTVSTDRW